MTRDPLPRFAPTARILRQADFATLATLDALRAQAAGEMAAAQAAMAAAESAGWQAGYAEGLAAAARLTVEAEAAFAQLADRAAEPLAGLVLTGLRAILGRFDDTELIARVTEAALSDLGRHGQIRLTVAPEAVGPLRAALAGRDPGLLPRVIAVEADPRLRPDQCRVQSDLGHVALDPQAQIEALAAALAGSEPAEAP